MNKKNVLIVIAGLAAVGTAIYFIFRKDESKMGSFIRKGESLVKGEELELDTVKIPVGNKSDGINTVLNTVPPAGTYPCASYKAESFPLTSGMKGEKSKALQQAVNKVYKQSLVVDGCFGPKSAAVMKTVLGSTTVSLADFQKIISSYTVTIAMNPYKTKWI